MDLSDRPFLTSAAPVPIDRPFTTRWARAQGVDPRRLRAWARAGLLVMPVHGVMHAAQLPDSLELRLACLRLVVPEDAVVTDRTAAWLHGAPMVLEPHAHRQVPPVDMFLLPGGRIRRAVVRSGQRELLATEIEELGGVRVTTRLRTTCDLGMKLPRKQAFAAMCAMLKVADFTRDDIRRQADVRFKGHRWVRQLRVLIPLCDPRFESPGECILALIWLETTGLATVRATVAGGRAGRSSSTSTSPCPACATRPSTTARSSTDPTNAQRTWLGARGSPRPMAGTSASSSPPTCEAPARRRPTG